MKQFFLKLILSNKISGTLFYKIRNKKFPGSAAYWENRYRTNGNSGQGSYGEYSVYKANILNAFIEEHDVRSVIEFGCGDGNQLNYFRFPSYIGLDASPQAIKTCIAMYKGDHTKSFFLYDPFCFADNNNLFSCDAALSLDVIYHLVEDEVFEMYIRHLFSAASRYVIIYAWDTDGTKMFHVRHRKFTTWINTNIIDFKLIDVIKNTTSQPLCDFFIYQRVR